jgi:hypothetical protein
MASSIAICTYSQPTVLRRTPEASLLVVLVQETVRRFRAVAGQPLARRAVTDSGRLGGRRSDHPAFLDTVDQQLAALDAESSVSVQLHPVSSLGLGLDTTSLRGGPDEQPPQVLQLESPA